MYYDVKLIIDIGSWEDFEKTPVDVIYSLLKVGEKRIEEGSTLSCVDTGILNAANMVMDAFNN